MELNNTYQPLVSVAMVTYNSSKYVGVAIESVLASTYQNFELVISDDCSTDDTWEIIKGYKDPRIKVSQNETNLGEYPNREKCIETACGKYIIFIDGDDMIYPWALTFAVAEIEKFPNASMALAMQWRNYIFYPYLLTPNENIRFTYFGNSFLNNSFAQSLFNTSILQRALPFPKGIKCGDTYIKKKISVNYDVLLINGPIAWWRQTPGQASEKINYGISGIIEDWRIDQLILSQHNISLTKNEIRVFWSNKHYTIKKNIIKQLLTFNFHSAHELFKLTSIKNLLSAKKNKQPNYQANANSTKPLMIKG